MRLAARGFHPARPLLERRRGHLQSGFAALLARRTTAGELAVDDPARAASQFFALLRGDLHPRLVMGCDALAGFDVEAHIQATVDTFLRAYAVRPAP